MKTMLFKYGIGFLTLGILAGCTGSSGTSGGNQMPPAPTPLSSAGGDPVAGSVPGLKKVMITMIAKSSNNPVFQSAKVGAERAAEELSKKYKVDVKIDWQTPPTEDGQVQAQRIAQAVNNGSQAILLSCSDAEKVTGAINDAVAKGVPVMTFDSDAPKSKRFAFYGADDDAAGRQVMNELAKLTDGKGNVAILAGSQNAPNLQKRVKGVMDEAKKYPGIKIVGTFNHIESPQDATAEVKKDMNAHPEITAWAMVGGWPLFAKGLLDLDPTKVKIVAVDALPDQLSYVDKGIAPVLFAQPCFNWGYVSVGKIVDKLVLNKPVDGVIKMDLIRVSKESLGEWAAQLQDWGFKGIDQKFLDMAPKKPTAKK